MIEGKKKLAILLCVSMLLGMSVPVSVPAATKQQVETSADEKHIVEVVSTQKKLQKALEKSGVKQIVIQTKKAISFTIPKGNYSNIKLVVRAPKAEVTNYGTFKSVSLYSISDNTFKESANNNKIRVLASSGRIAVPSNFTVDTLTIAKKNSNIKVDVDGSIKKMDVNATSNITMSGKSMDTNVVVNKAAKNTTITTAVPATVKLKATATVALKNGAEDAKIVVLKNKGKAIDYTLENKTNATLKLKTASGTKTLASGKSYDGKSTGSSDLTIIGGGSSSSSSTAGGGSSSGSSGGSSSGGEHSGASTSEEENRIAQNSLKEVAKKALLYEEYQDKGIDYLEAKRFSIWKEDPLKIDMDFGYDSTILGGVKTTYNQLKADGMIEDGIIKGTNRDAICFATDRFMIQVLVLYLEAIHWVDDEHIVNAVKCDDVVYLWNDKTDVLGNHWVAADGTSMLEYLILKAKSDDVRWMEETGEFFMKKVLVPKLALLDEQGHSVDLFVSWGYETRPYLDERLNAEFHNVVSMARRYNYKDDPYVLEILKAVGSDTYLDFSEGGYQYRVNKIYEGLKDNDKTDDERKKLALSTYIYNLFEKYIYALHYCEGESGEYTIDKIVYGGFSYRWSSGNDTTEDSWLCEDGHSLIEDIKEADQTQLTETVELLLVGKTGEAEKIHFRVVNIPNIGDIFPENKQFIGISLGKKRFFFEKSYCKTLNIKI